MARPLDEKEGETLPELVKDFEGIPLLGPNSLACSSIMSFINFLSISDLNQKIPFISLTVGLSGKLLLRIAKEAFS